MLPLLQELHLLLERRRRPLRLLELALRPLLPRLELSVRGGAGAARLLRDAELRLHPLLLLLLVADGGLQRAPPPTRAR